MKRFNHRAFVASTLVGFYGLLGLGGDAAAQVEAADSQLEEVTVTGSRVSVTSGMNTPVPVTVLTSEELDFTAPGSLVDALNVMPQFLDSSRPGNGTFGTQGIGTTANQSILNMRGLGTNRTLILLDGRRVAPTTKEGTVDISVLPDSMIARTEVVTGGASAAYGTDAVAGTTNFILDTEFAGFEAHLQNGQTTRGDIDTLEASFAFGTPIGDRIHFIGAIDHFESDALRTWDDREWFQDWGTVTNPQWLATGEEPQLLTRPNVGSTAYTLGGLINQPGSELDRLMFQEDGSATPFVPGDPSVLSGTSSQSGGTVVNIQRDRALFGIVPEVERDNVFAHATFDIDDDFQVSAQVMAGNNEVTDNSFPSVLFGPWQATIFRENAFLPEDIRQTMVDEDLSSFGFSRMGSAADTSVGSLVQENAFESYTVAFDKGVGDWRLDGYMQFGRNESTLDAINWIRTDRLFLAMDAVVDPGTGEIVCNRTLFDPSFDCVPIDLLGPGRASTEAIAYVTEGTKARTTTNRQRVFEVTAETDILDGWTGSPIALATGVTYREDTLEQIVVDHTNPANDPDFVAVPVNDPSNGIRGIPLGFAGVNSGVQFSIIPNFSGRVAVKEAFSEVFVPLAADRRWAQQLNLSAAARYAEYTGSGGVWAWKAGLDWQAIDALRLRATVSRDVRAPNMSERFDSAGAGTTVMDPEFDNEAFTLTQIIGGNPNVEPEDALTRTFGLVLQPPGIPDLSVSIDWYEVDITGSIGLLGSQRIVTGCFLGAEELCAQITRDPDTNIITGLSNVFLNINEEAISGVDLELVYSRALSGDRSLTFRMFGGLLNDHSTTNIGAPRLDRAGETGNQAFPDVQVNANVTYRHGPFTAFVNQRYIGEGLRSFDGNRPELGGVTIDDNTVESMLSTDLRLSYRFDSDAGLSWEIFGNVTNVFDEDPPRAANHSSFGGSLYTNNALFDVLGRRFVVGARFQF